MLIKHIILQLEAELVVGVTCNRWHKSQSDAIHGISWCGMEMVLETSSCQEVLTVI